MFELDLNRQVEFRRQIWRKRKIPNRELEGANLLIESCCRPALDGIAFQVAS